MPSAPGVIHEYAYRKIAFEFQPVESKNVLIFIGGLMDGLLTVPYLKQLASKLAEIGWSLIQIQFTSSHIGWGTGSLNRDSSEIGELVEYLRSNDGGNRRVIGLMGHSTGCQNTLHYLSKFDAKETQIVDFGVLQAPVSDRVAGHESMPNELFEESVNLAKQLIDKGEKNELMPSKYTKYFFNAPINAYRWNSLMGVRGDDDFFSPDLTSDDFKLTFGKVAKPLLVLYSGADEFVPLWFNKEELMSKWEASTAKSVWSHLSHVVKDGRHNLGNVDMLSSTSEDEVRNLSDGFKNDAADDATSTVVEFIKSL